MNLSRGLVAAYLLNEGAGDPHNLVTGKVAARSAFIASPASWGPFAGNQFGYSNVGTRSGLVFDSNDTNDVFRESPFPALSQLSVYARFRQNLQWGAVDVYRTIISKGSVFENDSNFAFGVRAGNGRIHLYGQQGSSFVGHENTANPGPANNASAPVASVAATWVGSAIRYYVDGQMVEAKTAFGSGLGTDGGQPLTIGGPNTYTSNDRNFIGGIECVYLWDRVLTDEEMFVLDRYPYVMFEPIRPRKRLVLMPIEEEADAFGIGRARLVNVPFAHGSRNRASVVNAGGF